MNESVNPSASTEGLSDTDGSTAKVVYILYIVGILIWLTGLVGVVMAYVNRSDAPEWLQAHYRYQIRTFWIGGLYMLIGALLSLVFIGYFILLFWVIWLVVRCVKGMKALDRGAPPENVTGWMF